MDKFELPKTWKPSQAQLKLRDRPLLSFVPNHSALPPLSDMPVLLPAQKHSPSNDDRASWAALGYMYKTTFIQQKELDLFRGGASATLLSYLQDFKQVSVWYLSKYDQQLIA